jgi:hypothetical protein
MKQLCVEVANAVEESHRPAGTLGDFIVEWAHLEQRIVERARMLTERNVSVREAINVVAQHDQLPEETARELHELRQFRNMAVHTPSEVRGSDFAETIQRLRALRNSISIDTRTSGATAPFGLTSH